MSKPDAAPLPWRSDADGIIVTVRVTPRGGRDAIDGIDVLSDGRPVLKLRVRVPPEDGAANRAVTMLLAETLAMPRRDVTVIAGESARIKQIRLSGNVAVLTDALSRLAGTMPSQI